MKAIGSIILGLLLFTANIALAQDSLYMYKAGAVIYKQSVNNVDSVTFKKSTPVAGTVTDIDGNVYHTVTIGKQTWMVENLKTTKYHNGNGGVIPDVTDNSWYSLYTGAYCNYDNDDANGLKYGRLYNWYAVTNSQKLAPIGWHVATDAEWTTLINYLIANGYNYDGTKDDNRVAKSLASVTDWTAFVGPGAIGNDLSKNNTSGFSAIPGGYRTSYYPSAFFGIGSIGYWWSSDVNSTWARHLDYNSSYVFRESADKNSGFYVRCVKD